ncbi:hypothetical protein K435DRAFT_564980, partial [Dendrothele bispora CBS 962.96]
MEYINFEVDIASAEGVHIVGWPEHVPFKSPSAMTISQHINDIYNSWQEGRTHWQRLAPAELNKLNRKLQRDEEAGIPSKKPRAERSDKGKKHQ